MGALDGEGNSQLGIGVEYLNELFNKSLYSKTVIVVMMEP